MSEPLTPRELLILFGWEAAELSEGQAAKLLDCENDPVAARLLREQALDEVRKLWARPRGARWV